MCPISLWVSHHSRRLVSLGLPCWVLLAALLRPGSDLPLRLRHKDGSVEDLGTTGAWVSGGGGSMPATGPGHKTACGFKCYMCGFACHYPVGLSFPVEHGT